jgi:glycosyltransferase involved in cell wall biosynthesis
VTETVIPGRTGVLVPPGDLDAFAGACIDLLRNEGRRRQLAAGARAEALTRRWDEILDGVLDGYAVAVGKPEPAPVSP